MTNKEFAQSYFVQAKAIFRELEEHYKAKEWHLVVELILKGFLRQAGIEIPRFHDVGGVLQKERERLPQNLTKNLERIISVSRRLRQERETSFYGDEEQELPPSALYTEIDAKQAKEDAKWLMEFLPD